MARRATRGDNAQFTYDFGIAIAQSTVNKVARLTGVTLSLASAFYALKSTATEYVDTLRENTLRFGGLLSTMKAMQQAQDRLITGMSRFDVRDQMSGMNQLMVAGVDVKKNMDWIEKAAHATGKSFDQFSGMIASAVQGNLQSLVDAGLMTQRATKAFTKFQGNTKMMQGAIMNFLRTHKGLMSAIKNDFTTIEDGVRRLKAVMTSFLQSVIGKPNDPNSLYGSVARMFNMIADKFGKNGVLTQNMIMLRQYGEGVGVIMGWVVRNIGKMIIWLGRQAKRVTVMLLGDSETFAERMRSLVVWLEFWRVKVVDIFSKITRTIANFIRDHQTLIKFIGKVVVAYYTWRVAMKVILRTSLAIQGMIFACKALRTAIIAAGGAWSFFSKAMTVAMFKGAGSRALLRFLGMTPYKVNAAFLTLGHGAAVAFSTGFSAVNKLLLPVFGAFKGSAGVIGKVLVAPFWAMIHPIKTVRLLLSGLLKAVYYFFLPFYKVRVFFTTTLPKMMSRILPIVGRTMMSWGKVVLNFFTNLPKLCMASVKTIGQYFMFAFSNPLTVLKSLGRVLLFVVKSPLKFITMGIGYVKNLFTVIRAGLMAINASNPVGWIIIGITLLAAFYKKFSFVRKVVNTAVKTLIEGMKLLWNIIYGIFVYTVVAVKKAYNFFVAHIFNPVVNFFKTAIKWVKKFWQTFKDSTIGKFLNDYLVKPLKTVFDWLFKALSWIWDKLVWIYNHTAALIPGVNKVVAGTVAAQAQTLGLPDLTAKPSDINPDDDADYLAKGWKALKESMGNGGIDASPQMSKNPLLSGSADYTGGGMGSGSSTTNNITLSNGAVQIVVPKGVDIDEVKLARMVREEIRNLDRENKMRGGNI